MVFCLCHGLQSVGIVVPCGEVAVCQNYCVVDGCSHLRCAYDQITDKGNWGCGQEGDDEVEPNTPLNCKDKHDGDCKVFEHKEQNNQHETNYTNTDHHIVVGEYQRHIIANYAFAGVVEFLVKLSQNLVHIVKESKGILSLDFRGEVESKTGIVFAFKLTSCHGKLGKHGGVFLRD